MIELPSPEKMDRLTGRKFLSLLGTIAGSAWAAWWLESKLIALRTAGLISETVFEGLTGSLLTTEATFVLVLTGWYMGMNVVQNIKLAKNGGT